MQKVVFFLIPLLTLFSLVREISSEEAPPPSIRQLSDGLYRTSQEMVQHGNEGHIHEVVIYGKQLIEQTEQLITEVKSSDIPSPQKKKVLISATTLLRKTREAVRLGEQKRRGVALTTARKSSFIAKQVRKQIYALQ